MLKPFLAILGGVVAGFLMVIVGDYAAHMAYPPPADLNFDDKTAVQNFVKNAPMSANIIMLAGQFLAGFVAGWVTNRICQGTKYRPALVAGCGILAAAIANLVQIGGHESWYWMANILLILIGAWLGGRMVSRRDFA